MATNKKQTGIRFEPLLLCKITHVAKQNKRSPTFVKIELIVESGIC